MDKIISTRMDEASIRCIDILAKKLGSSKKAILENAIKCFAEKMASQKDIDIFTQTSGCWKRNESPAETVQSAKAAMRKSFERYSR
jgi:hypothetical protein